MKALGTVINGLLQGDISIRNMTKGKIFPNIAPQATEKDTYIVYNIHDVAVNSCQNGSVIHAMYSVFIGSPLYKTTDALGDLVRARLDRYKGTVNEIDVTAIKYLDEVEDFVFEERLNGMQQEYKITIYQKN